MTQDDRMETITDPAQIRATDEPDERTTPAPVGAAVGLDLDAIEARFADATADEVIYELWPALVAEVRRLTESRSTVAANLAASLLLAENRAESAEAEVGTLRAKVAAVEAHASRLAASLALTLYDAHPVYGSTALWHGGVGGQAITAHCAIINGGPPGMEWAEGYLPSMALSEFIATTPGFDLDAAKAAMLTDLRAALATTGEGQR